ncbi:tyrosine-type recombinase/integrase [Phaeodactylibacter xiamenensis]|uniref:tyrosine-type recombinase/integrase n=1 Tax=Phaeodactylibacter xiamenensis TaxID=1524460 RepID=UPI0024A84BAB|nr:tyrosine-type recombinase/integrase [Phaeodactylibacter xiamenensis]
MTIRTVLWGQPRKDGTAAVKVYVNLNGVVRYFMVDGIYIESKFWDKNKQVVKSKHPNARLYNAKIRARKIALEEHFLNGGTFENFLKSSKSKLLTEALEEYITLNKGEYSAGTAKAYRNTISRVRQFEKHYSIKSYIKDIDEKWVADFVTYMKKMGFVKATTAYHLGRVKKAIMHQRVDNPHVEKIKHKQGRARPKPFLTPNEIAQIEKTPDSELSKAQYIVRDFFLLAYYLLLRDSDVTAISKSNFIEKNSKVFYVGTNKKTKTQVIVPVSAKAKTILQRYDYDCSRYTNSYRNKCIRRVAEIAGISTLVEDGDELVPKWKLVSMHTARRSAATNLDMQGMSQHGIKMLGGWKNLASLAVYFRSGNMDIAEKAQKFDHFK